MVDRYVSLLVLITPRVTVHDYWHTSVVVVQVLVLVASQDLSSLFIFPSLTLILQDMDRKMIHFPILASLISIYGSKYVRFSGDSNKKKIFNLISCAEISKPYLSNKYFLISILNSQIDKHWKKGKNQNFWDWYQSPHRSFDRRAWFYFTFI